MTTRRLLRAAGILVWVFAGTPAALNIAHHPSRRPAIALVVWLAAFAVFGWAFLRASRVEGERSARLIAIQTAAALAMNIACCTGFEAALLLVVAVELGLMVSIGPALAWLLVQSAALIALAIHHMGLEPASYWGIALVGAEGFAFTVAAIAGRERAARCELERMNVELTATRARLAQTSRDAERLRIARDLHDTLGHDLVALHLQLERARHLALGRAKDEIEGAHGVLRGLLSDVRTTVSRLRDAGDVDLVCGLRALVEKTAIAEPRVHLELPDRLEVDDPDARTALVRCVQEIVTNAAKHSGAQNLWIRLVADGARIELTAADDGVGSATFSVGNGLSGMRERIEEVGGALSCETRRGGGFSVRASVPLPGPAR